MVLLWDKDVVLLLSLGKREQNSQYYLVSFQKIELDLFTVIL